mgnify:CR=1 FL=1
MKVLFAAPLVAAIAAFSAFAQDSDPARETATAQESAADLLRQDDPDARENREPLSSEPGSVVVLRGLDKVTARTRDFEINIGETADFGALSITPQYCRKRPPEETETYAFLQIMDRRTDGFGVDTEGEQIFSGWMFASRPAQNPLEHPVYDVWVLDCRD